MDRLAVLAPQLATELPVLPDHPPRQHCQDLEVSPHALGRRQWRWLLRHLPPGLEIKARARQQPLAGHHGSAPPGGVELTDLTGAQVKLGDGARQPLAVRTVGARHRHQVLHRRVWRNPPLPDQLLHRLRQLPDQSQATRNPARAAVKLPGQLLLAVAEARVELTQQPSLLQRRLRLRRAQGACEQQRLGLAHLPHRRGDGVLAQPPQCPHPLVAVDHDELVRFARAGRHHDRHLLPPL